MHKASVGVWSWCLCRVGAAGAGGYYLAMWRVFFKTVCDLNPFRLTPAETISRYLVWCMKTSWVRWPGLFYETESAAKIRRSYSNVINVKLCLVQQVLSISITPHDPEGKACVQTLLIPHKFVFQQTYHQTLTSPQTGNVCSGCTFKSHPLLAEDFTWLF